MNAPVRSSIRFLLNDELVEYGGFEPAETLLDYLRLKRAMRGTKEGCAEGDCGACTVLVGILRKGDLRYETVNACIRFTGTLDGCHVVTIEALASPDGTPHPVQQAMVDFHGSQCGFCTPGIVMSLYGLWLHHSEPSTAQIEKALQGNLCRCTGYGPIIHAAKTVAAMPRVQDRLAKDRMRIVAALQELSRTERVEIGAGKERLIIPADVDDLAELYPSNPDATLVAGATDVGLWVAKQMRDVTPLIYVGGLAGLQDIKKEAGCIAFGAGVSYTQAHPFIIKHFPQMAEIWDRIGGQQVRNMGTIGGNIANGSPIGDTPPGLIALGATVILRKGLQRRSLPLEAFFLDYGKQDRERGEFVEAVEVPYLPESDKFAVYKVTKRFDEDITAVCGAFRLALDSGSVSAVRIVFGGMAGTPKRAAHVEAALAGKPWSDETVEAACAAFEQDFTPLTDMRASAGYRLLVAQNLLRRFYLETSAAPGQLRLYREAAE